METKFTTEVRPLWGSLHTKFEENHHRYFQDMDNQSFIERVLISRLHFVTYVVHITFFSSHGKLCSCSHCSNRFFAPLTVTHNTQLIIGVNTRCNASPYACASKISIANDSIH